MRTMRGHFYPWSWYATSRLMTSHNAGVSRTNRLFLIVHQPAPKNRRWLILHRQTSAYHFRGGYNTYDDIVDGISKLNVEDESKLFVLIPTAWKAELRKDADYKAARMGEVVYNG